MEVAQLCPTLSDPMDYTVHRILQARKLEWVAFPFSRGSSKPRDQTQVSHIEGRFFISWATEKLKNLPGPRQTRMLVSLDAEDQGCQQCIPNSLLYVGIILP